MIRIMHLLKVALFFCFLILSVLYFVMFSSHLESKGIIFQTTVFNSPLVDRPVRIQQVPEINYDSKSYKETLIDKLTEILNYKLSKASAVVKKVNTKPACETNETRSNSCDGECLRTELSTDPRERMSQLVGSKNLQLTPLVSATLEQMAAKVQGSYEVVLLTAASRNHYRESSGLLKSLHKFIFPYLKKFKLVYYDLGLKEKQREQVEKYCNCTVVDFPFDELPAFVSTLRCYAWKPLIIKAHINQGNIVIWMDASVRFHNFSGVEELINLTNERGIQLSGPSEKSAFRTARSMYHFFGDEPCAYLQMSQFHATSGFFKRDFLIERAILEPWVACAVQRNCICPERILDRIKDNNHMIHQYKLHEVQPLYGLVHRYDQSAISLILHKLFYEYYTWIFYSKIHHQITYNRKDRFVDYFPSQTLPGKNISTSAHASRKLAKR